MAPLTINSTIKLPSGYDIPRLGFGVRAPRSSGSKHLNNITS